MTENWPNNKEERERIEIDMFIENYRKLPSGRDFKVIERGDKQYSGPDYLVKDAKTEERFGVELAAVYISDRSVPDVHRKESTENGWEDISYEPDKIREYEKRLLKKIADKIEKAKGYDKRFPMILSIYVNEYTSIFMDRNYFQKLVDTNKKVFNKMEPFSEIVFWPLCNSSVFSVKLP